MRQVEVGSGTGSGSGSEEKRKRPSDSDDQHQNARARPRPRLQNTHGISGLQQINYEPATYRRSIKQTCELYNLDIDELLHEVGRNDYLMNLPIFVDEYTEIDTWETLRTHLQSTAYRSAAKMQRIRARPANRNRAAKYDPIFFVDSQQEPVRDVRLHGKRHMGFQGALTYWILLKLYRRLFCWPS